MTLNEKILKEEEQYDRIMNRMLIEVFTGNKKKMLKFIEIDTKVRKIIAEEEAKFEDPALLEIIARDTCEENNYWRVKQ